MNPFKRLTLILKTEQDYYWLDTSSEIDKWKDDKNRLVDVLPVSVKKIEVDGQLNSVDIISSLKGLPENKEECLPRLKSTNFMEYCLEENSCRGAIDTLMVVMVPILLLLPVYCRVRICIIRIPIVLRAAAFVIQEYY